ncbi:unnamed protein product [[Candida] boidinii]|nr:unnamed protein product [[Candida] boidinii]
MTSTTNSPVASHHQIDASPYNTVNSNIALPQNNFLHNGNLHNLNLNNLGATLNNTSNTNTTTFTNNSIMNNSTTSVQNSSILPNQQQIPFQQQSIHQQPSIQQLQNQSRNDTSDESGCVTNQLRQEAPNQLRQITSRIFDSKGTAPRRYSGIDEGTDYLDDFDIDDEEFLGDMHQQLLPNMRYVNGSNNTNNLDTPNDNNNTNHGNHSRNDHYNQLL